MEDPTREITDVIHLLTQTPPSIQQKTIETYFTPDSEFIHPLVRTGSWQLSPDVNSRKVILAIYRWYKIMSPKIELKVDSVAFDYASLTIYVHIAQIFSIWAIPFHASHVQLVTVLKLVQDKQTQRFFIKSQQDLYQVNDVFRFMLFGFAFLSSLLQYFSAFMCIMGAVVLSPISWLEEKMENGHANKVTE